MKKLFFTIIACLVFVQLPAQDFQKELYDADLIMKYRKQIELSKDQVAKVKAIYEAQSSKFNSLKWDLDAELETLKEKLKQSEVNSSSALAQLDQVMELEEQLKKFKLKMLIDLKNELSAAQQNKLKELRTDKDMKPLSVVTSINDGQKVKLQVAGFKGDKKNPLYVIKRKGSEKTVAVTEIEDIDPKTIESIEVLKGKSATTLYGQSGENGVIVIKLKQKK